MGGGGEMKVEDTPCGKAEFIQKSGRIRSLHAETIPKGDMYALATHVGFSVASTPLKLIIYSKVFAAHLVLPSNLKFRL